MSDRITIAQQRILAGQCPRCGKEAAPYRLCYDHRFEGRMMRCLSKGVRFGVIEKSWDNRFTVAKNPAPGARDKWAKNSTPVVLPESDKRSRPRLRGIQVDVEATLIKVMERIGRPCTIEEITAAWGKLRDRRTASLPTDLAAIVSAQDKRARKMAKRAAQVAA